MARYRRVETKVWLDAGFKSFSAPQPNAQTLWLYLLCGPRTTIFPGLVVAREEVMASDLDWPIESFRKAFAEASSNNRVKVDLRTGVTVLMRALFDSDGDPRESAKPGNPNILKSWAKEWEQIPECRLKDEYLHQLKTFCDALKESFSEAFTQALGKAYGKASRNQDQDQEQKQEQEIKNSAPPSAGGVLGGLVLDLSGRRAGNEKPKRPKKPKASEPTPAELASVRVVLDKLEAQNEVAYTGAKAHVSIIVARLREGYTERDLRHVIGYCAHELDWLNKPKMRPYLRPETLFGPENISKYIDAARAWVKKNGLDLPEPEVTAPRIDESEVEPLWMGGHP